MNTYRADLHTHTVLSPCGDLYMSPVAIVDQACKMGIDILGITDHNATHHAKLIRDIGASKGLFVLMGAEVTTKEEVHCLTFFETEDQLNEFQAYLDEYIADIQNDTDRFGYQVIVDENENIVGEKEKLLISAINQSIDRVASKVKSLNGLFIPAHINKSKNSLLSQLGFLPPDLHVDALELSPHITYKEFIEQNRYLKDHVFIQSSDAHYLNDMAKAYTNFELENRSFKEIAMAFKGQEGRRVWIKE